MGNPLKKLKKETKKESKKESKNEPKILYAEVVKVEKEIEKKETG